MRAKTRSATRIIAAMTARDYHFAVAFGDLSFAITLFACGLFAAPMWLTGLAAAGMVAYWSASRARVLKRIPEKAWASQVGIALLVIIAIEAGAYWLGLGVAGTI